jgi:low affinity Fe/Cu permease
MTQDKAETQDKAGGRSWAEWFRHFAVLAAGALGTHWAFLAAVTLVVGWAATGPLFHFGESWQLVINTGTTIITFLMVFLIQTTQNRDSRALHLKLDELIRCSKARNVFADLEDASEAELDAFQREFARLRKSGQDVDDAAQAAREAIHSHARGRHPREKRPNRDGNAPGRGESAGSDKPGRDAPGADDVRGGARRS